MPKPWKHTTLCSNSVIDGALDEKRRTEEHLPREGRRLGSSILSANELQLGRPRRTPDSNSPPCSRELGLIEGATRLTESGIERFCNLAHRGCDERLRNGVNNSSGLGYHGWEAAHEYNPSNGAEKCFYSARVSLDHFSFGLSVFSFEQNRGGRLAKSWNNVQSREKSRGSWESGDCQDQRISLMVF